MKAFLTLLVFCMVSWGKEVDLYATLGIASHHFNTDEYGKKYNEHHNAYGVEALYDQRYTLAYLHFTNSRNRPTDIAAIGYRYDIIGPFGLYGVVGYQHGYCFDGFQSVECTEGRDNDGIAFMPMFYYRHQYFILDLIVQDDMIALKLNLKLYPY